MHPPIGWVSADAASRDTITMNNPRLASGRKSITLGVRGKVKGMLAW